MPKEPIIIGSLRFGFKKDAREFFKQMLARYRDRETVVGDDVGHLHALVERHPEALDKIGSGIRRFYRDATDRGTSCFWIERESGPPTDFSYISCVNAKGKSPYQEFAEACREAVREQLMQAKKEHFQKYGDAEGKVLCEITGERVAIYESHLDHQKPMTFQVIVVTFIKANQINIVPEMVTAVADRQFAARFVDEDLERRFREYHHSVATLRIVKPRSNLSLGGSERILKAKRPVVLAVQRRN